MSNFRTITLLQHKRTETEWDVELPMYFRSVPFEDKGRETWFMKLDVDPEKGGLRLITLVEHHPKRGHSFKIENIKNEPFDERKLGQDSGNHYPLGDPEELFYKVLRDIEGIVGRELKL